MKEWGVGHRFLPGPVPPRPRPARAPSRESPQVRAVRGTQARPPSRTAVSKRVPPRKQWVLNKGSAAYASPPLGSESSPSWPWAGEGFSGVIRLHLAELCHLGSLNPSL